MNFKKDYINYTLYTVLRNKMREPSGLNPVLKDIINRTIASDDLSKITFLIGKTDGLELLFKYILYISDKIDKAQLSVSNLRSNFESDICTLSEICTKINSTLQEQKKQEFPETAEVLSPERDKIKDAIKIDITDETLLPDITNETASYEEFADTNAEETGLSLLKNKSDVEEPEEIYDLSEITEVVSKAGDEEQTDADLRTKEESENIDNLLTNISTANGEANEHDKFTEGIIPEQEISKAELPEIEIEIKDSFESETVRDEQIANEVYYRFENKFFEDVKILEKLFSQVGNEYSSGSLGGLSEKTLRIFTQIIEISGDLGDLSRQLSFDLTADIFHTINIYFTKAIGSPSIISGDRLKLMDSSLALVISLIKGEDYMDYNRIVDKIVELKEEIQKSSEIPEKKEKPKPHDERLDTKQTLQPVSAQVPESIKPESLPTVSQKTETSELLQQRSKENDVVLFKMKYLVKEFEKNFKHLSNLKNEYAKFEALDEIDVLNNSLRLLAKISSSVKLYDVCKLAEVSYIFLKYLKDYRIDILDPEIQQIVKYIITSFKMLLTGKKPDDYSVLIEYLNDPVKIFSDS